MKKLKFVISFLSILGLSFGIAHLLTSCKEKDPLVVQGNIEGIVTDSETGQAISGVSVTIVANSNTTFAEQSKNTGSDGKFSFKDIEAGSYKLTFSNSGYEDNSKNISLTAGQTSSGDVTLKPIKPVLTVSTTTLDFGTATTILPIEIRNTGKGELNWSIVEDLTWLSVNPATGKTTTELSSISITIDRSLFTETSKTGTFTISSNGGSATVNVTAGKEIPVLHVSTNSLDFGSTINTLLLEISNTGQGTLEWSIIKDIAWLSVNPSTGNTTTSTSVTLTVDRSQLTENSKTASFIINSNGGNTTINVSISKASPVLSVTPTTLDFGTTEIEKSINVSNTGVGTLTFTATASQSWITLEGANSSVTTDTKIIKVAIQRAGLSAGDYSGSVVINSNSNSITVPVTATIVQPSAPDLLNGQASGITYNAAQVSGTLTSLGSSAITQYGHCWNTTGNPITTDNKTTLGGTSVLKSFSSNLTGLSASITYYVRAYATNSVGTTYSDAITFATLAPPTLATVQTTRVENIKHNQIDGVGNLMVLGDGLVTNYGFCYSSSNATPTINDSKATLGQTTQLGGFSVTMTGLQTSTKYYMRAYATNSLGTAYGTVVEATTTDAPPVVTSGLMAYYTFDNSSCNEAQGKTEYNGVKQGSGNPVWSTDVPGTSGKALQLSNDTYFQVATSPISFPAQYSYSIWLKTTVNSPVFMPQIAVRGHYLGLVITNNQVSSSAYWNGYAYGTPFNLDVSNLLLDANWHMLTVTRGSGTLKMYIDGVYLSNHSNSNTSTTSYPLQLGNGFTGKMDNFRIYNRELTQAEVTEIFNAKQ
jgi:hypothetical protein